MPNETQLGTRQRQLLQFSRMIYSRLLVFYPRDLRAKFGSEMTDVFEELLRDATVRHGSAGVVAVWGSALWELLIVASPLRLENKTLMAGALSFLTSSALFLAFFSGLKRVL
jgi:hypothetical protein